MLLAFHSIFRKCNTAATQCIRHPLTPCLSLLHPLLQAMDYISSFLPSVSAAVHAPATNAQPIALAQSLAVELCHKSEEVSTTLEQGKGLLLECRLPSSEGATLRYPY